MNRMDIDLTTAGDTLQSSASRLAAWVERMEHDHPLLVPYEVSMARHEALGAVDDWTAARSATEATGDSNG